MKNKTLQIRNSTAEFLVFTRQAGESTIDVRIEDETVWLTQKLLAVLFEVDVRTINEHLKNIFNAHELDENSVIRKFRTTAADGKNYNTKFYNLDAIISVGYRVNSERAMQFRQWATNILRDFAIRGYVLDKERLKNGAFFSKKYFDDLLAEIREIRASERAFYQKITDIYATAMDYSKDANTTKMLFASVQNNGYLASKLIRGSRSLYRTTHRVKLSIASFFFLLITLTAISQPVPVELRKEISQYGITWEFDKPMRTGQFVTGDWWVVGPVTIVKITPEPGPVSVDQSNIKINHWNDTSLKADTAMRNGSVIVLKAGNKQSYDSRAGAFDLNGCVKLPLKLTPNLSLISSISNTSLPVDNFCKNILWEGEYKCQTVMKTAAVLTCLAAVPPADAFRPPYVGTVKPIFLALDIHWDFLPALQPAGEVPSWEEFERYFQRPWIDHLMSWSQQELVPNENGPNYGREHARLVSIASLMLCLDVPQQQKEKLTIELIQRGIDLYGIAMNGGYWNEGGGHSSGRKWPILFASIMLGNPKLTELPETTFFQEDTQTYYGKGWFGQTALWQMIMHHGKRDTYEEKSPEQWEKWDKTSESYRVCCNAVAWTGTALAARYMKAIKLWGHDAHFDYIERWMREDDPYQEARGNRKRPGGETKTFDPFVTAMWKAHRKNAPEQEMSGIHRKWVWQGNKGVWIPNLKKVEF